MYAATALGIMEEAMAVEIAIGTLHNKRYLELYTPTKLLMETASKPLFAEIKPKQFIIN